MSPTHPHHVIHITILQHLGSQIAFLAPEENVPLIDGITDTLSQGYNDLQSLENCLNHEDTALDTVCRKQGCVGLQCTSEAICTALKLFS